MSPCHWSVGKSDLGRRAGIDRGAEGGREQLRAEADAPDGVPGPRRRGDRALLLDQPRVRVLLVGAHRPAHDDQAVELAPVGQRLALVELHPRQLEATREQLVLERRRWLAGDVLEREQGHRADRTAIRKPICGGDPGA